MTEYSLGETLIKAENLSLNYQGRKILRDINFEVKDIQRTGIQQGQVISLIGRSGIGKSQFFSLASGLRPCHKDPDISGCVLIKHGAGLHPVTAGEVGIIPQNYLLFNHRTVYGNLLKGIAHCDKKCCKEEADKIIRKYAEDFNLTDHLHKYPAELSGGQKQRVSIIQQVLTDNKFILLDEPFSGLDSVMIDKVVNLLLKISTLSEYNTLVIVSHDVQTAMAISDLVWVLAKEPDKEGATITHTYDLKEMGMAWEPNIRKRTDFQELVEKVKSEI
jgi:ABC-type nitrate/sulfonate/bicarbonate transport system ATPase subunit